MIKTLKRWSAKEWLFFFLIVPLILIIIYLLPQSTKDIFILKTQHPTLVSIFFSNYTHSTLDHIENNLVSYLMVMFLIFNINTNKKIFHIISLLNFIVVPIISSLLTILIILSFSGSTSSQGFSAVVSAFIGYLLYSVYSHLKKFYYPGLNSSFVTLIYIINAVIWAVYFSLTDAFYSFNIHVLIVLSIVILALCFLYLNRALIKEIATILTHLKKQGSLSFYSALIFCFTILFIFPFWFLLPSQTLSSNTNTIAHFVGYCFGVFAPFILCKRK